MQKKIINSIRFWGGGKKPEKEEEGGSELKMDIVRIRGKSCAGNSSIEQIIIVTVKPGKV